MLGVGAAVGLMNSKVGERGSGCTECPYLVSCGASNVGFCVCDLMQMGIWYAGRLGRENVLIDGLQKMSGT